MYMMTPVLKTSRRLLLISSGRLFRIKLYYSVWIRFILIWIRGFPDPVGSTEMKLIRPNPLYTDILWSGKSIRNEFIASSHIKWYFLGNMGGNISKLSVLIDILKNSSQNVLYLLWTKSRKSFYNVILLIKMKRIHNTIFNYGLL